MTDWFKAKLGRVRVSTIVLIVAFIAVWWLYQTYRPAPTVPEPVPATNVVPPGFVPDPAYTWVPRTSVRDRETTTEPTTTTTTPTTTTETTTPTSPGETTSPTSPTSATSTSSTPSTTTTSPTPVNPGPGPSPTPPPPAR